MKALILKTIPLLFLVIWPGILYAQTITTTAGSITSCPGEIQVSLDATNCNNIGAISLMLNFDNAQLSYIGYQNLHAALTTGLLIVNSTGSKVYISWASTTPANIGNGTLMKLKFTAIPGITNVTWDTQVPGNCEYSDPLGNLLPAAFVNGTETINQPPVINIQPVNNTVLVGQNTSFSLSAIGTGLACLWQISTNGGSTWGDLSNNATYSGVTTNTLSITNALLTYNGYKYRCRLTGTCTPVIYSNVVVLTVINPITTILPVASFCPGNIVVPVTVTNFSSVAAFSLTFSYDTSFLAYTGHQNLNGTLSGGTFVSSASGGKVYLTWYSTTPASFASGTIVEIKFSAVTGSSTLSWDTSVDGNCEYTAIDGTKYSAVFSNGSETVYGLPAIVSHPANSIVAKGQNASFTMSATGSGLVYLWQLSTNGGGTWGDLTNSGYYSNVTTPTLTITGAQMALSGYQYRCRATGNCSPVVYTNPASLTVLPNILTSCQSPASCPGTIIVPVNVTDFIGVGAFSLVMNFDVSKLTYTGYQNLNAALSGGTFSSNASNGHVYLTWSRTTAATIANGAVLIELKFTGIPGASPLTWDTQTPGNCEYSDINGLIIFSTWTGGNATVNQPPVINANPVNTSIYAGGNASFSVAASGSGLGYTWQVSTNGGSNWNNITSGPYSGINSPTLAISPANVALNGYLYRCYVTGICTPAVYSGPAQLTVTQAAITTTPGTVSGSCTGNITVPLAVTNCSNVGSISLALVFDTTKMVFRGYHSVNAALAPGMSVVNRVGNKILFTWASTTAANIGTGTLVQFRFRANAGISTTLAWDTQTPGNCEYSDINGAVITSFYNTSTLSVSATALVVDAGNNVTIPPGGSTQMNGTKTGGTAPFSYLWTPASGLSNPAILNPVASPAVTTTYILTVTGGGCTGSDPVTVTVGAVVPPTRNLQNITVASNQVVCYDATQTINVAGNGTTFQVQNGGSATLVAGQNIRFFPGTAVHSGGYLHGYITTTGNYCGTKENTFIAGTSGLEDNENLLLPNRSFFRVYPNPTTGNITLELNPELADSPALLNIYNMMGEVVLSEVLSGSEKNELSIAGHPGGVYFISFIQNNKIETKKIVKLK